MIEFLADMPFWAWFVIGAALLVAELLTGTTFLLWPAIAAVLLGLITTVQLDGQWVTQWLLFAVLTVGLGVVGKPYAERWVNGPPSDRPTLNRFSDRERGKRATVVSFSEGQGRVQLGDTEWSARLADGARPVEPGQSVEVVGTDGTVLIVAPRTG
jgi:membrane protein implicated in regulation of membrane protease activity